MKVNVCVRKARELQVTSEWWREKKKAMNKPPEAQKHKWLGAPYLEPAFNLQTQRYKLYKNLVLLFMEKKIDIVSYLYHH